MVKHTALGECGGGDKQQGMSRRRAAAGEGGKNGEGIWREMNLDRRKWGESVKKEKGGVQGRGE